MPSKKTKVDLTSERSVVNDDKSQPNKKPTFPIVGVGASAGGLEACEALFSGLSENCGMSFVVVMHLDPNHISLMSELLQKKSALPVSQVADGIEIQVNRVYVIPPNHLMEILNGKLYLTEFVQRPNFPIDGFLKSLAADQGSTAIAIILSGTGSDGSEALVAIKDVGATVFVQRPDTAQFDGMPQSAISTGLVDFVLPIHEIPEQLLRSVKYGTRPNESGLYIERTHVTAALQDIFVILLNQTDNDFSLYKQNTLIRRIERRMGLHQLIDITEYVDFLRQHRQEVDTLAKELLIGVTHFFRDTEAFEQLKLKVLPKLLESKPDGYVIRVWVPGCSSGEEAYSIAIVLKEVMEQINRHFPVQIFGTDLDERAIEKARTALFPPSIEENVHVDRLKRFFVKEEAGYYRIGKTIRDMLVFAPQNLIKDPPFTKLDILSCRNLLIYFHMELQKKLLPLFYFSLKPGGILFLGSSESIGRSTASFTVLDKKWKLFLRQNTNASPALFNLPRLRSAFRPPSTEDERIKLEGDVNVMKVVEAILSSTDSPPSIVIDDENNIVYVHGRTGRYLEPAEGKPNANVLSMARPGLKAELACAIQNVRTHKTEQTLNSISIDNEGVTYFLDITVKPILNQQVTHGLKLIIFKEKKLLDEKPVPYKQVETLNEESSQLSERERALAQELKYMKESLQTTIEELETSNEELKSTNEELQSTNEELQSTNEEMETSKEELQSLNEESSSVNAELQSRIDELSAANDDMKNLLDSTDIATIFLDIDLCLRRFTPRANTLIPLVTGDAGRPIRHFASKLQGVNLSAIAEQVLEDLVVREQEVWSDDGLAYQMKIRPYRTLRNVIDGVVVTFEDITLLKKTRSLMTRSHHLVSTLTEIVPVGVFHAEMSGKCLFVNPAISALTGFTSAQLVGLQHILNAHPDDENRVAEQWKNVSRVGGVFFETYRFMHLSGKTIEVTVQAATVLDEQGKPSSVAGTMLAASKK